MSEKCSTCELKFLSSDTLIAKCTECKSSFHPACQLSAQNLTKSKIKFWKCDTCTKPDVLSNVSAQAADNGGERKFLMDALRTLKVDINTNTDKKINEVLASVTSLAEEVKSVRCAVTTLEQSQSDLQKRCSVLERQNEALGGDMKQLQLQLVDLEQHARSANLEISGLPATTGEDIYYCLQQIAAAIGVPYSREDVSIAHRLRNFSKRRHRHPPIIAQFVSRSTREQWIKAVRLKKGLLTSEINPNLPPGDVYINEHLTPYNKALLGRARRLRKEKKLVSAGFFNGKVMVKTSEGESIRIFAMTDLDDLTSPAEEHRNRNTPLA